MEVSYRTQSSPTDDSLDKPISTRGEAHEYERDARESYRPDVLAVHSRCLAQNVEEPRKA